MLADLHLHSTCSDGRLEPVALAKLCWSRGLRGIAITDHDAWDQNPILAGAALPDGLTWVPGIELSTQHPRTGIGFHVLGYGLTPDRGFVDELTRLREARRHRVRGFAQALAELGIRIDAEAILDVGGSPGKPGVARAALAAAGDRLRAEGVVDVGTFIQAYLAEGRPAFVPKYKLGTADGVDAIRRCGGHPVWAHPSLDLRAFGDPSVRAAEADRICDELIEAGLEGLEAVTFAHSEGEVRQIEALADSRGLRTTAGSDFHDPDDTHTHRLLLDRDQDLDWLLR